MGTKELESILEAVLGTPQEQMQRYLEELQQDMIEWMRLIAPTQCEINRRGIMVPIHCTCEDCQCMQQS